MAFNEVSDLLLQFELEKLEKKALQKSMILLHEDNYILWNLIVKVF